MVAYGGGVNSTALLVGMVERGAVPDAILFADTGGEKPETYAYVASFSRWLHDHGFPSIVTVRNDGMYKTLENNCLQTKTLPSIAFGHKTCSEKYKQRPQHKWVKAWKPAQECWAAGGRVIKLIGYGADEIHRAGIKHDDFYVCVYLLIEWGWGRDECIEAIERNGLTTPIKSACFYCPSSTKSEVVWLANNHPDLMARALEMERAALESGKLQSVLGLGRRFAWEKVIEQDRRQMKMFPLPCAEEEGPSCLCLSPVESGRGIDSEDE
jgi:hypothetical protein